jgi:leader peptidase (prepilin peptidase)/N-methyltransferase
MALDQIPYAVVVVVAGMVGAIVGSFLNVCISRWPAELSVVSPRSRCPGCETPIAWYDNVPVLSWLLLRSRCRQCGIVISVMYPLVELATAGLWAFVVTRHGLSLEALQWAMFLTILLGIAMTDARQYIIPDEFSLGGLVLGLLFSLSSGWPGLSSALLGAAVGFAVLWVVGWLGTLAFKEEAMGGGDIKMMAMVGAFLGWQGALLTIFAGALVGSLIFVPLSLVGERKLVPFGVFLSVGAATTWLFGEAVLTWYRGYLGV